MLCCHVDQIELFAFVDKSKKKETQKLVLALNLEYMYSKFSDNNIKKQISLNLQQFRLHSSVIKLSQHCINYFPFLSKRLEHQQRK